MFPADLRLLTLGSYLSAAQFWKTAWAASPAHYQRKSLPTEAQLFRTSRTQRRWADFPLCSKYNACSQSRSNQTPSRRQVVGDRKNSGDVSVSVTVVILVYSRLFAAFFQAASLSVRPGT